MKVLMINRADAFELSGGDTIQMLKTKEALEKLGISVDITTNSHANLEQYDIIHLFNLMKPYEIYLQIKRAKNSQKKIVISTIYQSNEILKEYYQKGFYGHPWIMKKIALQPNLYNWIKYKSIHLKDYKLWGKSFLYLQKYIVKQVDVILPNSMSELMYLKSELKVVPKAAYIIPNGIDDTYIKDEVMNTQSNGEGRDYLFVPGRIEPLKNQISIIEAVKDMNLTVIFAGEKNEKHKKYLKDFEELIAQYPQFKYIGVVDYEDMKKLYKKAKVTILASWFETTGLVALEGGILGSNIVITDHGYTKDYFKNYATYCNPSDIVSIREAIIKSMAIKYETNLSKYIKENYTWEKAAKITIQAYRSIM